MRVTGFLGVLHRMAQSVTRNAQPEPRNPFSSYLPTPARVNILPLKRFIYQEGEIGYGF